MKSKKKRGAATMEYGLLGALIAGFVLYSVMTTGQKTSQLFCNISARLLSSLYSSSQWCIGSSVYNEGKSYSNTYGMQSLVTYMQQSSPDKLSGFYTADGKEIKSMDELTSYLGLSSDDLDNMNSAQALNDLQKSSSEGKQVIFPIPDQVSWTSKTDDGTYAYRGMSSYGKDVNLYYYTNPNNQTYVLTLNEPKISS